MPTEKTFVEALKKSAKRLDKDAFVWKTNDRASIGIPDLYMVIRGVSVHLEAKVAAPVKGDKNPERGLLGHCFTGPQIGTMRMMSNALALVGGIIRTSRDESWILDPLDIPTTGQVTYQFLQREAFKCVHDGKLWRIDQWIEAKTEARDLSLAIAGQPSPKRRRSPKSSEGKK